MNPARLAEPLAVLGAGVWVVGGAIRDALLDRPVLDVDLAVAGDADAAARALARHMGATRFPLSAEFGAWRLSGGRLPWQVDITPLQGPGLTADLARRDLTVNAIAMPLVGGRELVDPHGGERDLREGVVRAVGEAAFLDDPVRVMRAGRLAHELGFRVEPHTLALARAAAPGLWGASAERLRDELYRCVRDAHAHTALAALDAVGALGVLVPQLEAGRGMTQTAYHHLDVLGHTLEVVRHAAEIAAHPEEVFRGNAAAVAEELAVPLADGLTGREALMLAALLHDMAKPETRTTLPDGRVGFPHHGRLGGERAEELLERLRVARRVREHVVALVRDHLLLGFMVHRQPLGLVQVDRYLRATDPARMGQLVLSVADRLATDGPRTTPPQIQRHLDLARQVLSIHVSLRARGVIQPPVPGDELARRVGREPGPWLARALARIREVQLVRTVTPESAVGIAREIAASD
ncbi:MAG: HD domain-containing protein [Thermoleophilia bacterium]